MTETSGIEYTIRPLETEDAPKLQQLTDIEGWNHSSDYLEFCRTMSGGGFFVAFGKDGQIISHCGITFITRDLAFLAYYITQPKYRGKGVGRKVFETCMKRVGDINVGLNASADKQSMYAAGGFRISSFQITGFIGTPKLDTLSKILAADAIRVEDIHTIDSTSIEKYDDGIHIIPRHEFLKKWVERDRTVCKVAMDGETIVGYGCMWPAVSGYRVKPLYAESKSAALSLWKEFCSKAGPGEPIEVAVPSQNAEAIKLFTDTLDLVTPPFYNVRMFTKNDIKVNLDPVYSMLNYDNNLV